MPDGARSMTALPEGVTRHGDALHIDLKVRTELLEKGGVLELKAFRLLLVRIGNQFIELYLLVHLLHAFQ